MSVAASGGSIAANKARMFGICRDLPFHHLSDSINRSAAHAPMKKTLSILAITFFLFSSVSVVFQTEIAEPGSGALVSASTAEPFSATVSAGRAAGEEALLARVVAQKGSPVLKRQPSSKNPRPAATAASGSLPVGLLHQSVLTGTVPALSERFNGFSLCSSGLSPPLFTA